MDCHNLMGFKATLKTIEEEVLPIKMKIEGSIKARR